MKIVIKQIDKYSKTSQIRTYCVLTARRIPHTPVLGSVRIVAICIISHEQTQLNRVFLGPRQRMLAELYCFWLVRLSVRLSVGVLTQSFLIGFLPNFIYGLLLSTSIWVLADIR